VSDERPRAEERRGDSRYSQGKGTCGEFRRGTTVNLNATAIHRGSIVDHSAARHVCDVRVADDAMPIARGTRSTRAASAAWSRDGHPLSRIRSLIHTTAKKVRMRSVDETHASGGERTEQGCGCARRHRTHLLSVDAALVRLGAFSLVCSLRRIRSAHQTGGIHRDPLLHTRRLESR
jgi:methionine aminopeptidase